MNLKRILVDTVQDDQTHSPNIKTLRVIEKEELHELEVSPQDVPSSSVTSVHPIDILHEELSKNDIKVDQIGRIINDGIIQGYFAQDDLKDIAQLYGKTIQGLGNIDVITLADRMNYEQVDHKHVIIGNAFMWNVLKAGMNQVRDKCDNFNFKISAMAETTTDKIEFNSKLVHEGQFCIPDVASFERIDLLEIYRSVTFRKSADFVKRAKHLIKSYLVVSTVPACAIWHYGLRLSGASHKKTIENIPNAVVKVLIDFLLALCGFCRNELNEDAETIVDSVFFKGLGNTEDERLTEFQRLKDTRDSLIGKFRTCISDSLNEVREMPYDYVVKKLLPPPRGKPLSEDCVSWKQYEDVVKKCYSDPSVENMRAKDIIESRLNYKLHLLNNDNSSSS
ncbi:unnamed protein product [Caenorhabditis bovis]|uniref:Uncharacterized protein n=1 Tax=Caenorhabditis bovis TaxID=2654633 RepID=A0A8S1F541_9PELO|nr:unnamed protein product [Caenorhabditis bovis]